MAVKGLKATRSYPSSLFFMVQSKGTTHHRPLWRLMFKILGTSFASGSAVLWSTQRVEMCVVPAAEQQQQNSL